VPPFAKAALTPDALQLQQACKGASKSDSKESVTGSGRYCRSNTRLAEQWPRSADRNARWARRGPKTGEAAGPSRVIDVDLWRCHSNCM